jgi:hypothetical protein
MASCKRHEEDPKKDDDNELITRVTLRLTPATGTSLEISYNDPDGSGGNPPSFSPANLSLKANAIYTVAIVFANAAGEVTGEIEKEGHDHEIFYQSIGVNLTISNVSKDSQGLPLGLSATLTAGSVSDGSLRVTLKHKPGQKAAGDDVSKGSTDVEVSFPIRVEA